MDEVDTRVKNSGIRQRRRTKISMNFYADDAVARRTYAVLVEKTRAHRLVAAEAGARSVGEFAGHRSTEQCAISLPSRTTFFPLFFFIFLRASFYRTIATAFFITLISSWHCLLHRHHHHHHHHFLLFSIVSPEILSLRYFVNSFIRSFFFFTLKEIFQSYTQFNKQMRSVSCFEKMNI